LKHVSAPFFPFSRLSDSVFRIVCEHVLLPWLH